MAQCLLAPGEINLGWNDISNVLLQDGEAVFALGSGNGKNRAIKACEDALSNYKTAAKMTKGPARLAFPSDGAREPIAQGSK
jgi:cell division GTPase FtsZ